MESGTCGAFPCISGAAQVLAFPKQKRVKDKPFRAWVITLPCAKCGREGWTDENGKRQGIIAHHQPKKGHSGTGTKTSDRRELPLCCNTIRGKGCHETFGEVGRDTFWGDIDVESLILRLNQVYDMIQHSKKCS